MDKYGINILYHLHQCRPCTSLDIFSAKVGKCGMDIIALDNMQFVLSLINTNFKINECIIYRKGSVI